MLIESKWVVYESRTRLYYAGNDKDGMPTPQPLSSQTRLYKSRRAAQCAIDRISALVEYYDFLPYYIERQEVPDTALEAELRELTEVQDTNGWKEVYAFAVPGGSLSKERLCLKVADGTELFGVKKADGKIYSAGFGGGEKALRCFCDSCYEYLLPRVTRQERERNKNG